MGNLSIYQQIGNKRLEQLDGLRGICALVVLVHHVLIFLAPAKSSSLTFGVKFLELLIQIFGSMGLVAVIIFFVLSGFVIGYTTPEKYSKEQAKKYLFRRFIRLYPIYLLVLLITFALSQNLPSIKDVIGAVFFTQGWFIPQIPNNEPLWTLHYEFMFYLLFVVIWKYNIKTEQAIAICFICAILATLIPFHPLAILGYFALWLAGFWLSKNLDKFHITDQDYDSRFFWSSLILISAFCIQNILATFVYQHGIPWSPRPLICNVLTTAVTTQLVASLITRKKIPLFKISSFILLVFVIAAVFYGWQKNALYADFVFRNGYWAALILLLVLPLTFWLKRVPVTILKKWSYLGSISYALYAVHYPILILFNNLSSMVSKFPLSLLVFNLIGASISILIAWLLECQMQPKVAKYLKARFGL